MKKLKKSQSAILRGIAMIIYGVIIIIFGIIFPGKWLFTSQEEVYQKIDLTNFQGEIYNQKLFRIYPLSVVEHPEDELDSFINNASKISILLYDENINSYGGVSAEVYIPDTLRYGGFLHVKKSFGINKPGQFFLNYENKHIIVTHFPSPFIYILFFLLLVFCLIYGFFKIKFNVERIKDELRYSKE